MYSVEPTLFPRIPVNLCIQSKYMKIRTRKNSVFGHFSRSDDIKHQVFLIVTQSRSDQSQKMSTAVLNPLMSNGNKKVTYRSHKPAGLFKYVWPFCCQKALKG